MYMINFLNIRQKIPSKLKNLADFYLPNLSIPRKIEFSGHFRLNTVLILSENHKFEQRKTLIFK